MRSEASRYPKGKLLPSMRTMNETIRKLRLEAAISAQRDKGGARFYGASPRTIPRVVSLIVFARRQNEEGAGEQSKGGLKPWGEKKDQPTDRAPFIASSVLAENSCRVI